MKILITGASGFVGKHLVNELNYMKDISIVVVGKELLNVSADLTAKNALRKALSGSDVVIHLAARVHIMQDKSANPLAVFRIVNVDATLNLARQLAAAGVKRFIFLSSIKVNGEFTLPGLPFTAYDANPQDPYGISKYEAEVGLHKIAAETGMQVVIIRPPLIYGTGVKANFASLLRMVKYGMPLPLGAITQNRRSFVALDNLIDLIITCINHPNAADQTFLVSDDEDVSTTDLLRKMAVAQGVSNRLLPVPVALLNSCAKLFGKQAIAHRLLGNLQVDISHTQKLLNWQPIISLDEGLRRAVINFK